jgi:hypothetical protein
VSHVKPFRVTLLVLAVVLGTGPYEARSQSGDQDFRVESWNGGVLEANLRLGVNWTGPGIGSMGSLWSARYAHGGEALFANPALLGLVEGSVSIDGRAAASNGLFGVGETAILSPSTLRQRTDALLDDLGYASPSAPGYTRIAAVTAGQGAQIGSIIGSYRVAPGLTVAAGYHRPLSVGLGFRSAGVESVLDAARRNGAQTIAIDVLAQLSGAVSLQTQMDVLSAGFGVHVGTDDLGSFHVGAAISRYSAYTQLDWSIRPELMIVLSGSQQYFFNDPQDPNLAAGETNNLFWNARARYAGDAWGGRIGLRFATPENGFVLSVTGRRVQNLDLRDPNAYAESYLPLFVNLSGELDAAAFEEDLLDVESLNLAKPNLTRRTTDSLGTQVTFRQPDVLTIGLDLGLGPHTLTANYLLYDGEISAEGVYGSRGGEPKQFRLGKKLDYGVRLGLDLKFPDRLKGAGWLLVPIRLLFLDLDGLVLQALGSRTGYSNPHYRIGGGLVYGEAVVSGVERNIRQDLESSLGRVIPSGVSMARRYTLFDQLDVGFTVAGVPDLLMRMGLVYRLR